MIEMVYSSKESEEQGNVIIPKNIRQIGENDSNQKIYVEDTVMNGLQDKPQSEDDIKYGVLLGEIKRKDNITYVFVKGMIQVRDVIENSLIFNDDIWSNLYKDIKKYFDRMEIVGWFVSVPYRVRDDLKGIRKIHLDNFAGNDKICFLSDRAENEDNFYLCKRGRLEKQKGYYIYYEKNEKMKKYIKNMSNENQPKNTKSKSTNLKNINLKDDKVEIKEKKVNEPKSFREILNEEKGARQGKAAYGISGLLIVALLLSTVVMLNNYGELKNIKQTLSGYTMEEEAKEVNQILNDYEETTEQISESQSTEESETICEESVTFETVSNTERATKKQKAVSNSVGATTYTVKKGQTLYDISMKVYGTSEMVDKIKEYNDIDDDYTIIEGQKIKLP
jgi:LysM repeat protein